MVGEGAPPSRIDAFRPGQRPDIPRQLQDSFRLWLPAAAADLGSVLFAASRIVHLGAVIAALILMFHPAASAYIRTATHGPARRGPRPDGEGGAAS